MPTSIGDLASVMIGLALIAPVIKLLDFLFSQGQKDWIRDKAVRIWYWLSNQRNWDYLSALRSYRVYRVLAFITLAFIVGVTVVLATAVHRDRGVGTLLLFLSFMFLYLASAYFAVWKYGRIIYTWLLTGRGLVVLGRLTALALLNAAVIYVSLHPDRFISDPLPWPAEVILAPIVISAMSFSIFIFALLLISLPALYAVLLIPLLMLVFQALEVIMARIAEHKDGPLLAVSAGLAALAAILKSVSE